MVEVTSSTVPLIETAHIVSVAQVVEGDVACETCGAPAVLYMATQPDDEPGYSCWVHAEPWLTLTDALIRKLFG